jgi:hypothetical protein
MRAECRRVALFDDFFDKEWSDRQKVNLVGHTFGSLNRCNVRINQNGVDTFFFQSLESLRARVVEFAGFSDF